MIFHFVCISGFRQNESRIPGTWLLAEKLRAQGYSSGSRLRVTHTHWRDDWENKAGEISNLAKYYNEAPRVAIFAYSWGAGFGAMQLADGLYRRGLKVENMVLSDPVYRHPWFFMRWLAMVGGSAGSRFHFLAPPVISLPPNVIEAQAFYQTIDKPAGHKLAATGETLLHPPTPLARVHAEMDDAPEFHAACTNVARAMIQ